MNLSYASAMPPALSVGLLLAACVSGHRSQDMPVAPERSPAPPSLAELPPKERSVSPQPEAQGQGPLAAIVGGYFRGVTIEDFKIDRREVTVEQYEVCVEQGRCPTPQRGPGFNSERLGHERHPVNGISAADASAYCEFVGKRLPTSMEWLWMLGAGMERRPFPWGSEPATCQRAVLHDPANGCQQSSSSEVGSRAGDLSRAGVADLASNVGEWTSTVGGFSGQALLDPEGAPPGRKLCGGSRQTQAEHAWFRRSHRVAEVARLPELGSRCVLPM